MKQVKLNTQDQLVDHQDGKIRINDALEYVIGKKALYTIVNEHTGNRFTYKTHEKKSLPGILLVSVLNGSDNTSNYAYLGYINKKNYIFKHSEKSKISPEAQSFKVFDWVYNHLRKNTLPANISVYHHNQCSRCGRVLTVPSSISSGIGPECIKLRSMGR